MNADNILYSPIPALQKFVAPDDDEPSRMEILSDGLLRVQMDLARVIMYSDENYSTCPHAKRVRFAMSLIADIYDEFQNIKEAREKYMQKLTELE